MVTYVIWLAFAMRGGKVSILCSRILSTALCPSSCLRDKILAKLGAEICGCKKQGNVNTTEESYGPEVMGGRRENVVEIEKMRPGQKRRNRGLQRTIGPPDNVLCIFL